MSGPRRATGASDPKVFIEFVQARTLGDLLSIDGSLDRIFVVPDYQRFYTWDTNMAGELARNLTLAFNINRREFYILGTFVTTAGAHVEDRHGWVPHLPPTTRSWNWAKASSVVDGQQRLTTVLLIMAAMRRIAQDLRENGHDVQDLVNDLHQRLYVGVRPGVSDADALKERVSRDSSALLAQLRKAVSVVHDNTLMKEIDNLDDMLSGIGSSTAVGAAAGGSTAGSGSPFWVPRLWPKARREFGDDIAAHSLLGPGGRNGCQMPDHDDRFSANFRGVYKVLQDWLQPWDEEDRKKTLLRFLDYLLNIVHLLHMQPVADMALQVRDV